MRVNVYHEELTTDLMIVTTEPRPGTSYLGLRIFLESSDKLHHKEDDDDRSAVTIWLGSIAEIHDFGLAIQQEARKFKLDR